MKIAYLKKNTTIGGQYFIKIVEHEPENITSIIITVDTLTFEPNQENHFETEIAWYKKEWLMIESDKKFIEVVKKLNNVSNL